MTLESEVRRGEQFLITENPTNKVVIDFARSFKDPTLIMCIADSAVDLLLFYFFISLLFYSPRKSVIYFDISASH